MTMPEKARRLYPYDESPESKEVYSFISQGSTQSRTYSMISNFSISRQRMLLALRKAVIPTRSWTVHSRKSLTMNWLIPIRHYIKEMGGMALLTRSGEKDIARQMEESKEEIKQVMLSFPGTVKELMDALMALKNSRTAVQRYYTGRG